MKNKITKYIYKHSILIYSLVISFVVLLFTSKCSFLYKFNNWVDANAFFTVGKSLFQGVLPYRDIFEQKGLLLYIIYGIGYLISNKTFYGVFILEVISFSILLVYVDKITRLFLKKKYSYVTIPIYAVLITTGESFVHGGSCEEYCLPLITIGMYYYLKHFKEKELSFKEYFINGLLCGCVLMMKFNLIMLWFVFMASLFLYTLIYKKEIKKSFMICFIFLLGMFIPFGLISIFYLLNHGFKDFIYNYFVFNATLYSRQIDILTRFTIIKYAILDSLTSNIYYFFLYIILIIGLIKVKMSTYLKINLVLMYIAMGIGIFWGGQLFFYYKFPLNVFVILSVIFIIMKFEKIFDKYKKIYFVFSIMVVLLTPTASYLGANYKYEINYSKDNYFQYKYAEYINKYKNPTLITINFLDSGVYTTTGIIPNTYYFEVQNVDYKVYPENIDSLRSYAKNKEVDFIVYIQNSSSHTDIETEASYLMDNYELIYKDLYLFERSYKYAYLFKLKDLK